MGRDKMVDALKKIAERRKALIEDIDIRELWETFNTENEWIDLATMTGLCFPNNASSDHESAVVRAFFGNRLYFKFDYNRFYPNSEKRVARLLAQIEAAERRRKMIDVSSRWLQDVLKGDNPGTRQPPPELIPMLQDHYIGNKVSASNGLCQAILKKAGLEDPERIFSILTKLGVWDYHENVDLLRYEIPTTFSGEAHASAAHLVDHAPDPATDAHRHDLTALSAITIDGQSTLDFDDALSIEDRGDHYILGVHIADVGHYVRRGTLLDMEAMQRGSSVYMPDQKLPMLPPKLAEDLCSLKAGHRRPTISTLIAISPNFDIIDFKVIASMIEVKRQLTYYEANVLTDNDDKELARLKDIGTHFRQTRLNQGAIQISLPEVNVWLNPEGNPIVNKINRESPGRLLVSEIMIMANWHMARFLADRNLPAVYRTQANPKERLFKKDEGSLFQNWMQRKLLSRFILNTEPEHHTGLGLNAYVTATSPIRKYFDLATQRQIRAALGLEPPYSTQDFEHIIQTLEQPLGNISKTQYARQRYWLLKYLETQIGLKTEAIVLAKRRNSHVILLREFMTECTLPLSVGINLKPEDLVQVTIQQVDARRDHLAVFIS
jgi:exoribonuclease-2